MAFKAKLQAKIYQETIEFFIDEARKNLAAASLSANLTAADDDDDAKTVTTFCRLSMSESGEREPPVVLDEKKTPVLAPKNAWHKYIWLCYRRVLTIIHGEQEMEPYFHQLAKQVMVYCVEFERKAEFVKLVIYLRDCEVSKKRKKKLDPSKEKIKLSIQNASSYHDTFVYALDICMKFEFYEQAALLLIMIEKTTKFCKKPKSTPTDFFKHYEKLAKFFWDAGAYDFHASVLIKSYEIFADNQRNKFDLNKRVTYATRIILAISCVDKKKLDKKQQKSRKTGDGHNETDVEDDAEALYLKNRIGKSDNGRFFGSAEERPTWDSLSFEVSRLQLMSHAHPVAKKLFKFLDECKFREAKDQLAEICRTETRVYLQYYDRLKIIIENKLFADTAYKGFNDGRSRSTSGYSNASSDPDGNNQGPFNRREAGKPREKAPETIPYTREADPGYGGLSSASYNSSAYRSGPTPVATTQLVISTSGEISWHRATNLSTNRQRAPRADVHQSGRNFGSVSPSPTRRLWPPLSRGCGHLWSDSDSD